ncbi:hypothetical protein SeLEV6574_g01423 [Synchytrium endobioticum]|uniref:Uncharacterized protein n=1 Tax=Synchytrium endobioticum TaxID=286115 RepID=A0A507DDN5_9FUNG|nr:hypothetical protein SeLEV6574_g01423 [Synchytrium endobioticum]
MSAQAASSDSDTPSRFKAAEEAQQWVKENDAILRRLRVDNVQLQANMPPTEVTFIITDEDIAKEKDQEIRSLWKRVIGYMEGLQVEFNACSTSKWNAWPLRQWGYKKIWSAKH